MAEDQAYELAADIEGIDDYLTCKDEGDGKVEEVEPLDFDLQCVQCEYNLRGLLPDGCCPECGELIAKSMNDRTLFFAPGHYLASLRSGLLWLILGYVLWIAYLLFAFVFRISMSMTNQSLAGQLIVNVVALVPLFAFVLGVLKTTELNQFTADAPKSRKTARVTSIIYGVMAVVSMLMGMAAMVGVYYSDFVFTTLNSIVSISEFCMSIVASYALVYFLTKFQTGMRFSPHMSYAWLPKYVLVAYIAPFVLGIVTAVLVSIMAVGQSSGVGIAFVVGISGVAIFVLLLLVMIFNLILYIRLRKTIQEIQFVQSAF